MKLTTIAALLMTGTASYAGGLSDPIVLRPVERPSVGTAARDTYFGGFYAGAQFTRTEETVKSEEEYTPETEVKIMDNCVFTSGHSGGEKCDDVPSEVVIGNYGHLPKCLRDYSRNCIVKVNGDDTVRIFIKGAERGDVLEWDTGQRRIEYGETVMRSIVDSFVDEQAGAFAGYRVDTGAMVFGIEASTDGYMTTAELSAGIGWGNALVYAFGGAGEFRDERGEVYGAGVEYMMDGGFSVGLKATVGDFGDVTTEALGTRISLQF